MRVEIDEKDKKILDVLIVNSNLSIQQISKKTGIPITTVHNRIKKLRKKGIIKNYTISLDYQKLGRNVLAYVLVNVNQKSINEADFSQVDLMKVFKKYECVEEASLITGTADVILKVRFENLDQLSDFILNNVRTKNNFVGNSQTLIVLRSM